MEFLFVILAILIGGFVLVWLIANALSIRGRAKEGRETITTFAMKSGFASGLAARLLWDAADHVILKGRPGGISSHLWLLANGVGLAVYLVVYLSRKE